MISRFIIVFFLFLFITITFSQSDEQTNFNYLKEYLASDKVFNEAGKLFLQPGYDKKLEELEEQMNRQALNGFREILTAIIKDGNDSLAFHCYYKIGVLEHYFDNLKAAQKSYLAAISLKEKLPALPDSFLFKPFLYTGSIYYSLNQFDSALNNYKKADRVAVLYNKPLNESQRLYNTLGVLYYETGNYIQAKNYFKKALSVLTPATPFQKELSVNYKNNLASVLIKLEEYEDADSIYKSLLQYNINREEILNNIGTINLNLGAFKKALEFFTQLHYNNSKNVKLLNDMGLAIAGLKENDSAKSYFNKALEENLKWNGNQKNISHGLTFRYLGDLAALENNYRNAAAYYQQAIIQFNKGFHDINILSNPENYSGIFSYINLFSTFVSKAEVLEEIYNDENDLGFLTGSLNTYHAAFKLADYVEQNYDSDEARMFLNKIKYTVHSKPISISIKLYEKTQNKNYLEQAYVFDQQNKASILSFNVKENELRNMQGSLAELFNLESSVKSSITRLSIKALQISDSAQLRQLNIAIMDNEIQLGKLREKMNEVPEYRQKRSMNRIPSINEVRQKLDNTSAILSYHLSGNELLILVISGKRFDYVKQSINDTFFSKIDSLKSLLHHVGNNQHYLGNSIAGWIYKVLITPVLKKLTHIEHLVIIPDDELNYLPFEVLTDENRNYLLENFSIHYQFSTALLFKESNPIKATGTLAFAPFASQGFEMGINERFDKLPFSKEEVAELNGKIFTDTAATKSNFLKAANKFDIIHLATHAYINNDEPLQSFIAFYPSNRNNPGDFLLYAGEIYNLNLDSTELVVLSACETGSGKLIKGEGLMSLSRAFTYAGCSNIITSLWKAEDKATSFLTQRLHFYLNKKFRKDKALQLAKLDLLNSNNIDPGLKSPQHWSHLIYIGQYIPERSSSNWWWFAGGIILLGLLVLFFRKKNATFTLIILYLNYFFFFI